MTVTYDSMVTSTTTRWNGSTEKFETVRKRVRGVKKSDSPPLTGYQLYHKYIRPHQALDGRTPADVAGIDIKSQNKWITIIQNASTKHRESCKVN
jgi:hypothetical protein